MHVPRVAFGIRRARPLPMAMYSEAPKRWVLVTDSSRARIFAERLGRLELLESFEHCESRDSRLEIMWGTFGNGDPVLAGTGGSEALVSDQSDGPQSNPKTIKHERFARQLAARLERGLTDRAYNRLVITAPPSFLSRLRAALSLDVEGRVQAYISRDLSRNSEREVTEHLAHVMAS